MLTPVQPTRSPGAGGQVFELWENPRFPLAFLSACVVTLLLALLPRFGLRSTAPALLARAGRATPYFVATFLAVGLLWDVRAAWGRRSPALTLSVRGGELVVRKARWPAKVIRAPLHAVRPKKGTWERYQTDTPELHWRHLPVLKVTVKPGFGLTIGAGFEPWAPRLSTPEHPLAWPRNLPRMKPPRYLARTQDWASLVDVLTAVDLQTSL